MTQFVPISAGVEKYYSVVQFITVAVITLSLLLTVHLGVFIEAHSRRRQRERFFPLMAGCIIFQCAEIGLVVAPAAGFLTFWVGVDAVGLFLFSRSLFLFRRFLDEQGKRHHVLGIVIAVEALAYGVLAFSGIGGTSFFLNLSLDMVTPGPLWWLFLSESLGWVAAGIFPPGRIISGPERIDKRGRISFLLGGIIFICSLFLHHLLWTEYGGLILPVGLLGTVLCWRYSMITCNYLRLFLDSFEGTMDHIPLDITVISREGVILTREGDGPGLFGEGVFEHIDDIATLLEGAATNAPGREFIHLLKARRFKYINEGVLFLDALNPPLYLAYSVKPVRYWRKSVAWILTFRDVTEEEDDIRRAALQEQEVARFYEKLKLYRKTGLYLEIEEKRKVLMDGMYDKLGEMTAQFSDQMTPDPETPVDAPRLERLILASRKGLEEIRMSVNQLKKLRKEELE